MLGGGGGKGSKQAGTDRVSRALLLLLTEQETAVNQRDRDGSSFECLMGSGIGFLLDANFGP